MEVEGTGGRDGKTDWKKRLEVEGWEWDGGEGI